MGSLYLSIVLTGRNDDHGGDFTDRFLRTLRFNHRELVARGIAHEMVMVEWAPLADRPLLRDLVEERLPDIDQGVLRTIVVDRAFQSEMSLNPRMKFLEFGAKNVGVRRASAPFILSTNSDVYLGRTVLDEIARRALVPRTVYRAARFDLKTGVDQSGASWGVLEDPSHLAGPPKLLKPPLYARGTGDFLLLDRGTWHELRAFNEIHRASRLGVDRNFLVNAYSRGIAITDFGGPVYHVSHAGSFRVERTEFEGESGPKQKVAKTGPSPGNVIYDNRETWGLRDAPSTILGPNVERLEFNWNAVPPLVDLRRLSLPKSVPSNRATTQ